VHKQEHALKTYGCVKVEFHAVTMALERRRCSHMGTRQIWVFTFIPGCLNPLPLDGAWWGPRTSLDTLEKIKVSSQL